MNRVHLLILTALLTIVGLGVFAYKAVVLGFPLLPEQETRVWTVQARFSIQAGKQPVKAVLQIPSQEHAEDVVAQVSAKGYHKNGRVLRHARVGVSKPANNEN